MRQRLTVLDDIRVAKPCPASWEYMHGDDRVRHCTHCERSVYNISAMSREEAAALIESHEGRLCVRFYRRADGKIMTKDCPRGLAKVRARLLTVASAFLALLIRAVPLPEAVTGRTSEPTTGAIAVSTASEPITGKIAVMPEGKIDPSHYTLGEMPARK